MFAALLLVALAVVVSFCHEVRDEAVRNRIVRANSRVRDNVLTQDHPSSPRYADEFNVLTQDHPSSPRYADEFKLFH